MFLNQEGGEKYQSIYEKYCHLIFYIAYSILKNYELAEDATQNTLLYIALNLKKIQNFDVNDNKVKNYICIVTKHKAFDILRKQKNTVNIDEFMSILTVNDVEEKVIQKLEVQKILEIIHLLPQSDKEILELSLIYEYKPREIAKLLGLKYAQARKRLQRAKQKLTNMLGEDFYKE